MFRHSSVLEMKVHLKKEKKRKERLRCETERSGQSGKTARTDRDRGRRRGGNQVRSSFISFRDRGEILGLLLKKKKKCPSQRHGCKTNQGRVQASGF